MHIACEMPDGYTAPDRRGRWATAPATIAFLNRRGNKGAGMNGEVVRLTAKLGSPASFAAGGLSAPATYGPANPRRAATGPLLPVSVCG
jgi:hypothetical protein